MFETLGEKSRRELLIEFVSTFPAGTVIKYDELAEVINGDKSIAQNTVHAALKDLEREHKKTLVAVRGVGYRVVLPAEHIQLATVHQSKASRSLRRAKSKVSNVDYSALTPEQRADAIRAETAIAGQLTFGRRLSLAQANKDRVDNFIQSNPNHIPRTTIEVEEAQTRMAGLSERLSSRAILGD